MSHKPTRTRLAPAKCTVPDCPYLTRDPSGRCPLHTLTPTLDPTKETR